MQRGALESGLPSRPIDPSRRLPIQTTSAFVAVDTPLKTARFRKSQTPVFLLHRVVAAWVLRNQLICRSFRMESICSGTTLNERFRATPMISNDRSTKRFLAISVNRANRLEWQTVAVTLMMLPAWEEAAGDAHQAKTLVQGLKRARQLLVAITRGRLSRKNRVDRPFSRTCYFR
jgi:hypothetical protein